MLDTENQTFWYVIAVLTLTAFAFILLGYVLGVIDGKKVNNKFNHNKRLDEHTANKVNSQHE